MLDRLFALETFGIKLGLENISQLCTALGHPERAFTSLHVAGTNGKGSVTAMAHAALRAAGVHAARYTSPHLSHLAERFVIDDQPVDDATLEAVAADVLACADRLQATGTLSVPPTFFEATTAMAFELFRRAGVEVAVFEVGLGGRFDATNVLAPVAGAITTIGFDHQQHLGKSLEQIAFEKAGIIKSGMTIVAGALPPAAMQIVRSAAAQRGARLVEAAADSDTQWEMRDGRAHLRVRTPLASYGPLTLALRGEHQIGNAVVAARLLESSGLVPGRVPHEAIAAGLASADWPARLEELALPGGKRVIIDAAHNEEGATALAAYLRRWHPGRPALVLGVMRDKDLQPILDALLPVTSAVFATAAPTPRARPADELAAQIGGGVTVIPDPDAAIARALETADTVCVAGSIFLVGAVRDGLKRRAILH
ncbi:MAG TPA: folylpolyglutamate synthase/dihydrofolate synthase family protein [Vicinamibacterales bacterium]|nr:folylpolyglutamate synthase/dihydrofolate synthase family protein [Vicinamibacterales bacterium]